VIPWLEDLESLVDGWERRGAMETFAEIRSAIRRLAEDILC
jgi:hypothetical protein